MRILHVDDHTLFCEGLALLLAHLQPQTHLVQAHAPAAAADFLTREPFDLVLTDLRFPGVAGLDALETLRACDAAAPIVVLAASEEPALIQAAIDRGAMGFIPKSSNSQELAHALQTVLGGRVYLPPAQRATAPAPTVASLLTQRQEEVFRCLVRGLPNKLIARQLGISETTVKTHVAAVLAALGVRSRTQAVYALSAGLLDSRLALVSRDEGPAAATIGLPR